MNSESFYCEKLSATLQVVTCVKRFKSGNFITCRGCELGACHAGEKKPSIDLSHTCSRCLRTVSRLIYDKLCVSCCNRQLEVYKGADRRGKPPKLKIETITVFYASNEGLGCIKNVGVSMVEVMVDLARVKRSLCVFRPRNLDMMDW